jgi:hypothetical protein
MRCKTGFFARAAAVVSLLLHFDGDDEDTTTTDSSAFGRTVTLEGGAIISTTEDKFGGSSLLLDGVSGSVAAVPHQLNIRSRHFTVDCWVWLDEVNSGDFPMVCEIGDNTTDGIAMGLTLGNPGENQTWHPSVWGNRAADIGFGLAVTPGQWVHLAWAADHEYVRMFVDGVEAGAATINADNSITASNSTATVGGTGESGLFSWTGVSTIFAGHIDELRIVVGRAEWTAGFTPPTAAYT